MQYLQDEGYTTSVMTIQDEANVKHSEQLTQIGHLKKMKKAILGTYIGLARSLMQV